MGLLMTGCRGAEQLGSRWGRTGIWGSAIKNNLSVEQMLHGNVSLAFKDCNNSQSDSKRCSP